MRKLFVLITCLILVFSFIITASAAEVRTVYYLYRDFKPITENEDGTILRRLTLDSSNMFGTLSSLSSSGVVSDNYQRQIGMQQFSFTGNSSYSYWLNIETLGVYSSDIQSNSIWSKKNVISLEGFRTGSMLFIGYGLTGANIADDHHDIWVDYYDSNFNFTEQIQYTSQVSTNDGRFFSVEIPIGVGSNVNNSYFAIRLQIDDIIPINNGTVTISLTGMALTTSGTVTGGQIWNPITPPSIGNDGTLKDFGQSEDAVISDAFDAFGAFSDFANHVGELFSSMSHGYEVTSHVLSGLLDIPIFSILFYFSVSFGCVSFIFNLLKS